MNLLKSLFKLFKVFRYFKKETKKEDIANEIANKLNVSDEEKHIIDFIINKYDYISKKCNYGDNIEKLNEYERVFLVTQILEMEVNNGGFDQFFFNSSGDFSNEIVDAFTKINAFKTAEICKKALSVFNGPVPTDREKRMELLDELEENDEIEEFLNECDNQFYKYEDKLEELTYSYLMKYKEFFN